MDQTLSILQIIVSTLLITSVMVQHKGVGLSGVFGGEGNVYRTKRGLEKWLTYATVFLAAALVAISLALLLI